MHKRIDKTTCKITIPEMFTYNFIYMTQNTMIMCKI